MGARRVVSVSTIFCFIAALLAPSLALARPPRTGKLSVFSITKGATIEIDGNKVGTAPLPGPIDLPAGNHTVRVSARGHLEFNETVAVRAGETVEIDADLIPTAGMVRINANVEGATVAIDGNLAGQTPFDEDVLPGKHEIAVTAPGHNPYRQTHEVLAGKWLELNIELDPGAPVAEESSIASKWWLWTIIGGAVAVGLGVGLGVGLQPRETEAPRDAVWALP